MTITAQLTLADGERSISVPLCSDTLATLAEVLLDHEDLAEAFDYLSRHADYTVRMAIARKQFLSVAAVRRLAGDPAIAVANDLLRSSEACKLLTNEEVLSLCKRDPSLAESVAGRYEDFALEDGAVTAFLESHADTGVRACLASNPFVPKPVLRRLAQNDMDDRVRKTAGQTIA
ncbi:MAG: hypothetical protein Q8M11_17215 [Sulfuritalea sp.]|nr:hypothetical protein [Sulfuritalea sp.]MDP1984728.1 hypothetical protein [Sulfuritalea sp.]